MVNSGEVFSCYSLTSIQIDLRLNPSNMMRLNLRIKSLSTQLNSLPHFTSSFNNINHKRTLSHQNQTFKFKSIKPFSRSQSTTQSVTENLKEISRSAKHESGKTMGSVINAMSAGKSSPQTQSGLSDSSLEVVSDLVNLIILDLIHCSCSCIWYDDHREDSSLAFILTRLSWLISLERYRKSLSSCT